MKKNASDQIAMNDLYDIKLC